MTPMMSNSAVSDEVHEGESNLLKGTMMKHLFSVILACAVLTSSAIGQTLYDLTKVKFVTSSLVVAVGNSGAILRSGDGGVSWSPVSSPTPYALRGLSFSDASNGWGGGGGNVTRAGT